MVSSTYDPPKRERIPGEAGVWVFVLGDLAVFSLFFATYLYYRAENQALFVESQHLLDQRLGLLNTVLMLTSSWFVASGVSSVHRRSSRRGAFLFLAAIACAVAFVIVKIFEWKAKIGSGFTLESNDFFMFYYILTGVHLLHVLVGVVVLAIMAGYSWSKVEATGDDHVSIIESGGCVWHVVDLLWIVIFALLYLMR